MQLFYIDENKHSEAAPDFWIGGLMIDSAQAQSLDAQMRQVQAAALGVALLDKNHELHGKDIFHGKGNFKGRPLTDRIQVLANVATFVVKNGIPVRLVRIDVARHRARYAYPMPAYQLGLMLVLERACDLLDTLDHNGLVFADYEKDEITQSVLDFSLHQTRGKTPMSGRSLSPLVDTIYFTQSHHSRFLQLADVVVFLAQRYGRTNVQWHEQQGLAAWTSIAQLSTTTIQEWL